MATTYRFAAFLELLVPIVERVRQEGSPMFPSVRLAQSWLETGGVIPDWNNLGGYKVGGGKPTPYWDGASVSTKTREYVNGTATSVSANWRAYTSIYNFFKDQDLLFASARYERVRQAPTPEAQCEALYLSGYASDPNYAAKLIQIITANQLKRYDVVPPIQTEQDPDSEKLEELNLRLAAMEKKLNLSGKEPVPNWAVSAVEAGMAVKAISSIADKSMPNFIVLQMLKNLGLLDADTTAALRKFKQN
ncbi:glycoside hydrolase family 73 protein [Paenibacillus physcomitrellae]|uniref:Mannosyl-glycoprotein endo-beta-N-acetylglucosamidase-like domain-containing protein n=1 Tax=Paenibacillus physcomitrellae TaxID=1619311 RepID=A0ABQ1FMK1_9BACL|nr:glucosaminidase domain-containing protein [Paenibacillus physcomitrellae]GGA21161.1 hypothetical protein GCM10010917_02350 [Paenibacillus physcomitrellae]